MQGSDNVGSVDVKNADGASTCTKKGLFYDTHGIG